tara:strand:- start:612 stop:3680 length:3069 start_codon:yes stop_codon:yes gene_type:complete
MATGELGLKFKAEKDCHITLEGAELGGPIYRVYDRQSGALLDTIAISPAIWTESGEKISEENFPNRTYHPNRYVVGDDQYAGLIIESRGASEEIQIRCGPAPAPTVQPRGRVRRDRGRDVANEVRQAFNVDDVRYGPPWLVTEKVWKELIPGEMFDKLAAQGIRNQAAVILVDETSPPGEFGGLSPWFPQDIVKENLPAKPAEPPPKDPRLQETEAEKWRREEIEMQVTVWDQYKALDKKAQKGLKPLHADFRESRDPNAPPGWGFSATKPAPHWYLDPVVASLGERLVIPPGPRQAQVDPDPDPGLPWDENVFLTTTTMPPQKEDCCNPKGSWYWERLELVNGALKPIDWNKHLRAGTKPVYPEDLSSLVLDENLQKFEVGGNNNWWNWMIDEAKKHVNDPEYAPWFADPETIENYNIFTEWIAPRFDANGIPLPRPPIFDQANAFLKQNVYPRYEQAATVWWNSYKSIWLELKMLTVMDPDVDDPNREKQIPNYPPNATVGRNSICPKNIADDCLVLKHKNDPDLVARLTVSGDAIQDERGAMVIPTLPERQRQWPPVFINGRIVGGPPDEPPPIPGVSSLVQPNYGEHPVVVDYDRDHDDEEFEICFKAIDPKWIAAHWTIDPAIDILSMGQPREGPGGKQIQQRILYVKDLKVGDKGQGWEVCKCCATSTSTTTTLPIVTTTPPPSVKVSPNALNQGEWFWNNNNDNFLTPFDGIPEKNMAFWQLPLDNVRILRAMITKWENLTRAYVPLIGGRLGRLRLRGRGALPEVEIGPMAGQGRAAERFGREYLRDAGYPDPPKYKEPTGAELEDPDYFKNLPSLAKQPCPTPWPWFWTKVGWRKAVPGGVAEQPYWPFSGKGPGPRPTGEEIIERWFATAMPPAVPAGGVPRAPVAPIGGEGPGKPVIGQEAGGPGIFEGGINPMAGLDPNIRVLLPQEGRNWRGKGDPFEGGPPWYKWDGLFFLQWIPVGWPCPEKPSTPEDWESPDGILSPGKWDHLWEDPRPPNWFQGLEGVDWGNAPT